MELNELMTFFIGLALGLAAGSVGVWAWFRYGTDAAGEAAARKREQAYRQEVADHFVKTAELVNRLTDSYKGVFDHLRKGAETLVEEETLRKRLAQEENKDVTLHLIGYRKPADPGASKTGDTGQRRGVRGTRNKPGPSSGSTP